MKMELSLAYVRQPAAKTRVWINIIYTNSNTCLSSGIPTVQKLLTKFAKVL